MQEHPDYKSILIVVYKDWWEAVPETVPQTQRDEMLIAEIKSAGGIDETVVPGMYRFNIIPGPLGDIVMLTPDAEWRSKFA